MSRHRSETSALGWFRFGGRDRRLTRQQRQILVATSLAVGLAFLDETAVVTALRAIQRDFSATSTEVQWVMGAYLLALASFMAAAGRLADMYGRRRLFLVGCGLFAVGSVAAASSPSEEFLIASRRTTEFESQSFERAKFERRDLTHDNRKFSLTVGANLRIRCLGGAR